MNERTSTSTLTYECVKSRVCQDEWVVEAIDYGSEGQIYAATFSGPGAEERAREYAAWKNAPESDGSIAPDGTVHGVLPLTARMPASMRG